MLCCAILGGMINVDVSLWERKERKCFLVNCNLSTAFLWTRVQPSRCGCCPLWFLWNLPWGSVVWFHWEGRVAFLEWLPTAEWMVKEIVVSKCLYGFNSDPGCLLPSIFLSSLNIEQEICVSYGMLCLFPWQCRALPLDCFYNMISSFPKVHGNVLFKEK